MKKTIAALALSLFVLTAGDAMAAPRHGSDQPISRGRGDGLRAGRELPSRAAAPLPAQRRPQVFGDDALSSRNVLLANLQTSS
jgi:hypothetical protein